MVQVIAFRHSSHGHWKPAAGTIFSFAEQDLRLASPRILYPYQCGVAGSLACQFPTRAAHGKRNEATRRIFALRRAPWSHD
jgi:hypothetical protein